MMDHRFVKLGLRCFLPILCCLGRRPGELHTPAGSDLFIVFSEERGSETSIWNFTGRGLIVKLTYLAGF